MYLRVKVNTSSKRTSYEYKNDVLFVWVKEPAQRGLANDAVCKIVGSLYKTHRENIRIVSGHHKPNKLLFIKIEN